MTEDLCFASAVNLKKMIQEKELSCLELTQAFINRVEAVNNEFNAIVTVEPEKALDRAKDMEVLVQQGELGVLHGLPVAHKDLFNTKGIRTTYGSPIFKDFVPLTDDLVVERQKAAGAVTLGKTNTPEFGAGSQTFNQVFGATKNPYDYSKTCGGSSGGAAVALAAGMVALADGSDMGGSLRNPAAFCNIVGFRPTPGLVPTYPSLNGWATLGVPGPMARTVQDIALFLGAIAGADARVPISRDIKPETFLSQLGTDVKGKRVAWALDFANLPFDSGVTQTLEPLHKVFQDLGCELDTPALDFSGADEAFKTFRAHAFARSHHTLLKRHKENLKETVIWNVEEGLKLSALDIARAEELRTRLFVHIATLMQAYDYIILPVTQVPPFDIDTEYITEINGKKMDTYIDWMKSCYYISVLGNPALSIPGGFTKAGLPVGLQIVGRYGEDLEVLQLAFAFEQATRFGDKRPEL